VHKFLTKGKQVGVQGELRQERWEQEGQARSKVAVFGFVVQLLGSRPEGSQSDDDGSDIPF
jgi:single-strand DNA-binding protein